MKKILSLSLVALILVSCGAKDTPVEETKKIPFSINTTSFESFPTTYEVQKTGRLTGSSLLSLTAQ